MADKTASNSDEIDAATLDTAATVRINTRQRVIAQIEAALLSDKLAVAEDTTEAAGSDPYNSGRTGRPVWGGKR